MEGKEPAAHGWKYTDLPQSRHKQCKWNHVLGRAQPPVTQNQITIATSRSWDPRSFLDIRPR